MKKLLLAMVGCLSIYTAQLTAQIDTNLWKCGHQQMLDYFSQDPGYSVRMAQLEDQVQNWISNNSTFTAPYTIPVVFHVLHDGDSYGTGSNLSLNQIKWQLNALNVAFANNYQNYNIQASVGPYAVNTQIKFCLATIPEGTIGGNPVNFFVNPANGQTECGVMRYQVPTATLNHDISAANIATSQQTLVGVTHPTGSVNVFPFAHYLNIWLVDQICDANCNIVGYATFPSSGGVLDGIVFRADVIGDNSIGTNNFNMLNFLQQGKIMAHEAGHYLGLFHTFHSQNNPVTTCDGNTNANCLTDGDLICDTPPTTITGNWGCATTYNTCTDALAAYGNVDQPDMTENFMSYSDDDCMNTFTNNQMQRMQGTLNSAMGRDILVSAANLANVGLSNGPVCQCAFEDAEFSWEYFASPCHAVAFLVPQSSSLTSGISYNWNFGDGTTGLGLNPVHTYTANATYTVTLTVNYSSGNQSVQTATVVINDIAVSAVSLAAGQVCNGSPQQISLTFQNATAPVNYTITNGFTTQSVVANTTLQNGNVVGQFYFTADINHPNYTVINVSDPIHCPRNPAVQVNLNIINCCSNLIANGDFELGNVGFTSDNVIVCGPSGSLNYGYGSVSDIEPSVLPNAVSCPVFGNGLQVTGGYRNAVLLMDCRVGTNVVGATNTIPFTTPLNNPAVSSILWQQNNVPLTIGHNYNIDFFIRSPGGGTATNPFRVRLEIFDNVANPPIFTSGNFDLVDLADFFQHSFTWNNTVLNGPATIRLSQVQFFNTGFYDPGIDDISIRRTNVPPGGGTAYAGPDVSICGGGVTLSGSGNPVYTWTPGATLSSTAIAQPVATPTTTTTYTLSVNNSCGISSDVVTVNVIPGPAAPTITATPSVICTSGSSSLSVPAVTGAVVNWYTVAAGGTPVFTGNPFPTPVLSANTTYYAEYQVGQCFSARTAITLSVSPTPTVSVSPASASVCQGTPVNLTASGATAYTWSLASGLSATSGATVTATPTVTTTYTVTGTTAAGCTDTKTVTITVGPAPTVTITPSSPVICAGQATTLTATGATTYLWDANAGSATTGTVTVSPITTTVYTLTTSDPGCPLGITTITVTANGGPILTVTPPTATLCSASPGGVTLSASGGTATYTWTPASGLSAVNTPTVSANPTTTTTYTVENQDATGCKVWGTVTVNVITTPTVTLSASPTQICRGNSSTLTASGAATYTWSPATGLSSTTGSSVTASPTVTTTYTVSGTTSTCTSATVAITLTVNPLPTLSITGINTICAGQSTTLTANGASTYTWSPGGSNAGSIVVSPTVTTTYTLNGTSAAGCPGAFATRTVTVNPLPSVAITPTTTTICNGAHTALTASGAVSYTWSPSSSLSLANGSTVTATPTLTTVYTVQATGSNGCVNNATATVNVTTVPTAVNSPTYCVGTAVTLTASGATTYSWSPSTGLSATIGSVVTAVPTSTASAVTYTVTGTASGCSAGATSTVTIEPNTCLNATKKILGDTIIATNTTNFGLAGTYSVTSIAIIGDVTVNTGTTTIACNDVRIAPGTLITVKSGATLNIAWSYLHSCATCGTGMWQGIYVENGGKLTISGGSRIEDANNAVSTQIYSSGTAIPDLQITQAIFNRNTTGIYLYGNGNPNNLQAAGISQIVDNCVFTCRDLSATPLATTTTTAVSNFNTIKSDIYNSVPALTVTKAGTRSDVGIRLNNTGTATYPYIIGEAGPTGSGGSGKLNIFDNLNYGINTSGTTTNTWAVKNSLFQYSEGNNTAMEGIGVYASGGNPSVGCFQAVATVANEACIFRNLLRGVHFSNITKGYIRDSNFSNTATSATFGSGSQKGEYAIYCKPQGSSTGVVLIDGNTINDCAIGIHINRMANYNSSGISVTNNYISSSGIPGTLYCNRGIFLEDAAASNVMASRTYLVKGNTVTNVEQKAIHASNVCKGLDIICNNELSVRYQSTGGSILNGPTFDVIRLDNCQNSFTEFNGTIRTSGGNTSVANEAITGIYINNTASGSNNVIDSNDVRYVGCCMLWQGSNTTGMLMRRNIMTSARYGMYMNTNAAFNTQSADNINKWGTAVNFATGFQTYNNSGANVNSIAKSNVWTGSAGTGFTYAPTSHSGAGGPSVSYTTGSGAANGFITTTVTPTPCTNCASPCPPGGGGNLVGGGEGGENMMMEMESSGSDNNTEMQVSILNAANDSTESASFDTERKWANAKWAFENLYANPALYSTDPALQEWYNTMENQPIGLLTKAESYMENQQLADAQTALNSITPGNVIEQNLTDLYQLYVIGLMDSTHVYSQTEIEQVYSIASGCEWSDGPAVLRARAFYNSIFESYTEFSNSCQQSSGARLAGTKETNKGESKFNVYPNPSGGEITFEFDAIRNDENAQVSIYSLDGKLISKATLAPYARIAKLSLKELPNGVYIARFIKNGVTVRNERLVIMK